MSFESEPGTLPRVSEVSELRGYVERPGLHTMRKPWRVFHPVYRMAFYLWWHGYIRMPWMQIYPTPWGIDALKQYDQQKREEQRIRENE
jgi:hypothetical protein